ncbi:MAG: glycosyltransferase family 4 protein [Muribaculaceae bacterium]|nr:glycosyltransferase family 4 protein [Muribaculaceae bacterium]
MNLAIISPASNAYSETFIQAHKRIKADKIFFYYGGYMPTHVEGQGLINISKEINDFKTIIQLSKKINIFDVFARKLSLRETLLAHSFRKNKIDVVLAEYGPSAVECLNVCKKLRIPLITHFHGFDVAYVEEKFSKRYKDVFDYSSSIIAVSKEMVNDLNALGASQDKLVYSPCGPNELFFSAEPHFKNKNLLFVGRLVDKKAPYYLIQVMRNLKETFPDVSLNIVGEGPLLNTCINLTKALGLTDKINFKKRQSPLEIKNLINDSFLYIQHSVTTLEGDKEGTPVGIMEASAASLPVVASSHAGIKDVIIDGQTGLLSPEHDIETMTENIISLLNNPEKAKKMGMEGRKRIKENFSLDKHLDILSRAVEKAFLNRLV